MSAPLPVARNRQTELVLLPARAIGPEPRRRGLRQLAARLRRDLARKRPQLTANGELRRLLAPRGVLRGGALKDWEDRLDAVVCGYIAAYYWWWGEKRCRVFGDDWRRGYIVTPWPPQ